MAEADFRQVLATAFANHGGAVQIDSALRVKPDQYALFQGEYDQTPAVFRVAKSERQKQLLALNWAELTRIAPFMSTGRFQVAQGLAFLSEHSIMVSARIDGRPFLECIKNAPGASSAGDLAAWLHAYCKPSITIRPAAPKFWIDRASKSAQQQFHPNLAALETDLLSYMLQLADQIDDKNWRAAISHGDYHPNNLLRQGEALYGIDLGGSSYLPIYKDMARCLVHLARRNIGFDAVQDGVDQTLIRAFSDIFELSAYERDILLPFFLCFECLIKVETEHTPKWRIRAAEALYMGLLGREV